MKVDIYNTDKKYNIIASNYLLVNTPTVGIAGGMKYETLRRC